MNLAENFKDQFPEVLINEPLRKYSTFQIGGPADYFYRLKDTAILPSLTEFARKNHIPLFVLGAGSNILFHDEGFRGLIIKIESDHISHQENDDHHAIVADAGVLIPKLLQFSIDEGLSGLEPWIGLPGTVGGAVRGNAGCNGLETKDVLINAVLFHPETSQITIQPVEYFEYSYRESKIKQEQAAALEKESTLSASTASPSPSAPTHLFSPIVLSASFRVQKRQVSAEEQQNQVNAIRQIRLKAQPPGLTTGSFFKNPKQERSELLITKTTERHRAEAECQNPSASPPRPAGLLIDLAGLKGHTIGHAQISPKHGNFFMNLQGKATSKDMLALAQFAQKTVYEKFGIHLEPEVVIVPPCQKNPHCL